MAKKMHILANHYPSTKKEMVGKKGKGSLNIPKGEKNEGEHMMFGKNNSQRA